MYFWLVAWELCVKLGRFVGYELEMVKSNLGFYLSMLFSDGAVAVAVAASVRVIRSSRSVSNFNP